MGAENTMGCREKQWSGFTSVRQRRRLLQMKHMHRKRKKLNLLRNNGRPSASEKQIIKVYNYLIHWGLEAELLLFIWKISGKNHDCQTTSLTTCSYDIMKSSYRKTIKLLLTSLNVWIHTIWADSVSSPPFVWVISAAIASRGQSSSHGGHMLSNLWPPL